MWINVWVLGLILSLAVLGIVIGFYLGREHDRNRWRMTGEALRLFAMQWGFERLPGESESELRARMVENIRGRGKATTK